MNEQERMFPIMQDWKARSKPHPIRIPWSIAELAYSAYSDRYGRSQSLEGLAQRGGFHPQEMDDFLPDWQERVSEVTELRQQIEQYKTALADAIRCPMGVVPDSAQGLLTMDEVKAAENRRIEGRKTYPIEKAMEAK